MGDTIRVLRVIEYTGPRDKVEDQVARSLHGEKSWGTGVTIRATTLGTFPEIMNQACKICCHHHVVGQECGEALILGPEHSHGANCACIGT